MTCCSNSALHVLCADPGPPSNVVGGQQQLSSRQENCWKWAFSKFKFSSCGLFRCLNCWSNADIGDTFKSMHCEDLYAEERNSA